jgi:hypothetical protein
MALATVHLVDSLKLGDFYFTKEPEQLALNLLGQGQYKEIGPFDVGDLECEDAAEYLFELANNPYRQAERDRTYGRGRSLSVGDVVQINGDLYLCRPTGWVVL